MLVEVTTTSSSGVEMMLLDQPAVLLLQDEIVEDRQRRRVAETTVGDEQQRQPPGVAMTTARRQHQGSSSSSSSPCLSDLRDQMAKLHHFIRQVARQRELRQRTTATTTTTTAEGSSAVVCHWRRPAHRRSIQPSARFPIMIHSQQHHQHRPCRTMKGNIIMTHSVITATANNSMDGTNWDFVPKARRV
jgi:hypothetical protein